MEIIILNSDEKKKIEEILPIISQIIGDIPYYDIDHLMEKYNGNKNEVINN